MKQTKICLLLLGLLALCGCGKDPVTEITDKVKDSVIQTIQDSTGLFQDENTDEVAKQLDQVITYLQDEIATNDTSDSMQEILDQYLDAREKYNENGTISSDIATQAGELLQSIQGEDGNVLDTVTNLIQQYLN